MNRGDLNEHPPPLVLRVEPVDGETFSGYLQRVADAHLALPWQVIAPISQTWAKRLRGRPSATTCDVAMTEPTTLAVAERLNLAPDLVSAMLLAQHADKTIDVDEEIAGRFDPVFGSASTHGLETLGWVAHPRTRRWCPSCVEGGRPLLRIEWRYPWMTLCPDHERPLNTDEHETTAGTDWSGMLDTQRQLLDILNNDARFNRLPTRQGFIELLAATEVLIWWRTRTPFRPTQVWPMRLMADVLPLAFTAVEQPIGRWPLQLGDLTRGRRHPGAFLQQLLWTRGASTPFGLRADLTRYVESPGHYLPSWARDTYAPREHLLLTTQAMKDHARTTFPRLWPLELTVPALTDYSPWLTTRDAQIAAAMTALMLATGDDLKTTCQTLGWSDTKQLPLRRLWWHLGSTGALSDYLAHLSETATSMLAESIGTPALGAARNRA